MIFLDFLILCLKFPFDMFLKSLKVKALCSSTFISIAFLRNALCFADRGWYSSPLQLSVTDCLLFSIRSFIKSVSLVKPQSPRWILWNACRLQRNTVYIFLQCSCQLLHRQKLLCDILLQYTDILKYLYHCSVIPTYDNSYHVVNFSFASYNPPPRFLKKFQCC